jgi:hypothetical protein
MKKIIFFLIFAGSSPAAPAPTTAMIMEGLETLVTPSHHAYLLTESAAAAHFNVLSFDTCSLFKTAATTASSFNLNNNNNHSLTNNNHQTQLLSSHHSHHHQTQMHQPTAQQSQSSNVVNTSNSSNTSSHSATSVTHSKLTDSTVVSSAAAATTTTSTSMSGHHSHPTLNIQETQHQTADRVQQQQTGDLNTPVTTSSDIPSFFGPSTVVEPPIITGMYHTFFLFKIFYNMHKYLSFCNIR